MKIQLFVGGDETLNEALSQALRLRTMFLGARFREISAKAFWGASPPKRAKGRKTIAILELWEEMTIPR